MRSPTRIVDVENNSLPLAQHAEDRALERVGGQVELGERGVADDAAVARRRVVALDDALHDVSASAGLDDLAALDATRADVHPLRGAADESLHTLDVRVPTTLGAPVGVRHVHAPAGTLATHFTYCCHDGSSSGDQTSLEMLPADGFGDTSVIRSTVDIHDDNEVAVSGGSGEICSVDEQAGVACEAISADTRVGDHE